MDWIINGIIKERLISNDGFGIRYDDFLTHNLKFSHTERNKFRYYICDKCGFTMFFYKNTTYCKKIGDIGLHWTLFKDTDSINCNEIIMERILK